MTNKDDEIEKILSELKGSKDGGEAPQGGLADLKGGQDERPLEAYSPKPAGGVNDYADEYEEEEAGYVLYKGKTVARQTLPGAFDWEAVRDKTQLTLADGSQDIPVARLMWNLGVVGHGEYGAYAGTAATGGVESFRDYFGFGDGLFYL